MDPLSIHLSNQDTIEHFTPIQTEGVNGKKGEEEVTPEKAEFLIYLTATALQGERKSDACSINHHKAHQGGKKGKGKKKRISKET